MSSSDNVGLTAVDVIAELLAINSDIAEVLIFEPSPTLLAQDRLGGDARSQEVLAAGLRIREQLGLPFWDAVLVSCFGAGVAAFPVLDQARFHNSPPARTIPIERLDWSAAYLDGILNETKSDTILVINSRVRLSDGGHRHIPMLDFHCPPNSRNEALALRVSSLVCPSGGYLLESGKSYHFYGKGLISERDLPAFLGHALLFSPVIDRAWIAHQLIEGACGLRISAKANSNNIPRVVAEA
jgi:hypothetical protein